MQCNKKVFSRFKLKLTLISASIYFMQMDWCNFFLFLTSIQLMSEKYEKCGMQALKKCCIDSNFDYCTF